MEYNDIKKLIDDMGNSKLDSLNIEFPDGIKISMTKNSLIKKEEQNLIETTNNEEYKREETKNIESKNTEIKKEENYKIIKSPMVGTFYASSSPEKEAFVKVGDKVKKGQVICIVEAMKLMNEIESEFDGEIVEICVKNEDVVDYGKPLFKLK